MTLQQSIVLCINGVDPQISSSVFDMVLPAWFIYDHMISPLFIATDEWYESYGKPLGICSRGSGCLEVDTG